MASANLGCDMVTLLDALIEASHVICTPSAGAVIKTYSPNLMVHPLMRQTPSPNHSGELLKQDTDVSTIAEEIINMLGRLHVLVIGPGLGRDPLMQETVARVIKAAREKEMPLVLDADALLVVQNDISIIKGYADAILTPNVVEFERLWKAAGIEVSTSDQSKTSRVEKLAEALGGVTIIQKGPQDFISDGQSTLINDLEGGKKRSGGQGDTLTGSIATFLAWRKAYLDDLWKDTADKKLGKHEMVALAAFGGSAITRESSRLAFMKKGRSLQASDLTDEVHNAFMGLFGEVDGDGNNSKL
ncbi:hypothetical protein Golomagni_07807 [Golovinomyces magnicellulatus]|nr:hypothetical protein Golomagni_07807 [Golovinomyces magnicellulatus]